jgi:hypothetical protein
MREQRGCRRFRRTLIAGLRSRPARSIGVRNAGRRRGFDVDPNATILTPQYSQSPPPNYYTTMNVVVPYVAAKPTIKVCLVPLFPRFPVEPACADAQIRS